MPGRPDCRRAREERRRAVSDCIVLQTLVALQFCNLKAGDYCAQEDIPTEQQQAAEDPRIQGKDGDQGRTARIEAASGQGSQEADC